MKKNHYLRRRLSLVVSALLMLIATTGLHAQVVGWSTPASPPPYGVFSMGTSTAGSSDIGRAVTTDASGNIYLYGTFGTGTDFDPGAGTTTLTSSGATAADLFVAKYNSAGQLQWVVRGGVLNSTDNNGGNYGAIATDGTNVYVVGQMNMTATNTGDFAPAAGGCTCAYAPGATLQQGFVAKLNASNGQWQWVNTWGSATSGSGGHGVCLDPSGNIYITGQCNGNINVGPAPFTTTDADAFFAKLTPAGAWTWTNHGGGTGADGLGTSGGAISYNSNLTRLTATGSYNSTGVSFGGFGIPNTLGITDIFLTEINPATGAFLNAFGFGSVNGDEAVNCYDPNTHDIFLAGLMGGNFSGIPGLGTLTQASALNDIFVARYTPNATPGNGTFTWMKTYGGPNTDRAWNVSADGLGSIVFCGTFLGTTTIDFGAGAATQVTSTSTTGGEIFVASVLASNGNGVWALQGRDNNTGNDQARGLCSLQNGTGISYTTGQIGNPSPAGTQVSMTPSSLGNTINLTSTGGASDIFFGKVFGVLPLTATQSQVNLTCNGVCTGSGTVVASGGIAPYTYSWSPSGGSGATASNLCATNYTCTITDAASSSITKTFSITQPPAIVITPISQTNVGCFGGSNGAASVSASGGTGTLTYNWTPGNPPGDGTGSVTGLTAQVYTVTVTDASSCTATRTFNITQPSSPVSGTTVVTNVACFGGNTGAINLTPSGGTGPTYTFNWLPSGPTTEDRTGLVAGTYSVQITDVNGCSGTVTATVTQPTAPVSGTTVVTNVACFGGNTGAINLTPTGGTAGYTFNWLPSGPTTEDRTGLVAGTYSVQITDVNGCTGTVTATVTQPTSPVSGTTVVTNVACFGGNTGAINLTPTGGTPGYTFNWLPSGPTTEDRTGLVAGTYSVQITDVNGCTGTVTATVTQPTTPVSGTTVVTNVACFGGNTGAINLTPSGGAGGYTFNWLPSGPTTEDRTGLVAGTYSVQITDVNGCTGTVTATVTQPTSPVSGTTVVTNVACFGGNTGAINLTPTGGTAGYTFNWLPSGPTTEDRTGLVAGTYSVQITDVNGCTGTVTATVTQPTAPVSGTTVVTNVACFGGNTGAINLTPTGGTAGYTFNWLPSGPTTEDRTGLVAGTYSVQITDVNGCTGTVTATVTQPTSPVSGTTVVTNVACFGGNTGAINLTPTGGTPGYTFNWLPSGPTTEDRTGLVAGTYSVQITDVNGCTGTVTATVTQPTAPVSGTTVVTNVACFGGNTGAINLTPSGGSPGYTFNWLPSGPTTEDRTGLVAGTYSVQITDANGCTGTVTATVTQPTAPVSGTTVVTNVACFGGNTGAINLTPTGGTAGYTFNWLPSGPTTEDRTGLVAGTYSVQITDVNGCTGTVTATVTQPTAPVSGTTVVTNVACFGGNTGAINLTPTGGTAGYTFNWLPSGPTTEDRTGLVAGTYSVQITDANGCTGTVTATVTQPTTPVSGTTVVTNVACFGGNTGAINLTPTGGTPGYTFNWLPSGPTTEDRTGLVAGTYSVQITDANGCTGTVTATVTQPTSPVSGTTVVTNVACFGGNTGAINLTPTGGTPGYTFNWLPSGPTTEDRTGLVAGTYSVQITDANGCTGTVTATVTQPTSPVSGTTVVTNVACFGGNTGAINLTPTGGTAGYTFNWLPSGPTTEDRTGLVAGTYSVQITDANGCTGTVTATVTQPTSPVSGTTVVTNTTCFGNNNGAIDLTPTGGTPGYTYLWLPSGPTTQDRTGLAAGTYSVQITDANGCTGTVTATVTSPASTVSGTTVVTNVTCFGGNTGAINLTPSGGSPGYTFNWLPSGPTTEDRTGLIAGTYSVQITDANGCTGTVTATVTQPTAPVSGTTVVTNVACFGGSTGAINLTPTGGSGSGYTFNWLPSGPTTEDRTGLVAGTYSVQITDGSGCTGTVTATVTQPTSPVSGTTVVTNVACFGGNTGAINLTPTGGSGSGYTFNWLPSGPTTEDRTGLVAGTYSVQITDGNGCTGTVTATVTQPTSPVSGTTVVTNVACFGGNTGAINLTPTGGSGSGYTFNWLPSGPTTEDRTGLAAGTYSVQITDGNGCTGTVTATVTQPTSPVSGTTVVTNVACFGGNTGAINLTPTGGSGSGYTFNWLPSGPTTEDRTGLVAGTYSVQITDGNGCTGTVTATVTQPTSPVSGTTVVTNVACFGGNTGAINLTPTGGSGSGYTFNWLPSGPTTEDRTGLVAGTYSVQITDGNGCTGTVTATVTQPTSPVSGTTVVTNVACFGGNTGAINLTPTGGSGSGYTFLWLPSGPTTEDRTGLAAGTYSVQITDGNGCTGTVTATVTQPTSPVSGTTVVTNVTCFGGNNGAIDLTPTGGTPGYIYLWLPSGPTTQDRTGLTAGTYSVQITDANGCSATVTATVTSPAAITVTPTAQTNVNCFGGNNGAAAVTASGGTGTLTFNWTPGNPTGDGTNSVTGLTAGVWTCTVTDINGCTGSATFNITQPPVLTVTVTSQTNILCNGVCSGSVVVTPTGGTPAYVYSWAPGGYTVPNPSGLCAGTYTCTVTDSHGCTAVTTVTITQPPAIVVTPVSQTNVSCNGGNNGAASVSATGGTGGLSYNWTPGNPTGDGTNSVTGLTAGTWSCTVTDINGCQTTQTFNITQPPALVVTPASQTNVTCNGSNNGTASVTASGGTGTLSYNWTPGNPTGDGTNAVTGLAPGTWSCTVTDANLCATTVTFNITQPGAVTVTPASQSNVLCNGGNTGAASVTASGGTGTLSYNWTPGNPTGDGTNSVTGLTAGTWSCTVTDLNGCSATQTFNITEPPLLTATIISQVNVDCNGNCNGSATIGATGGTPGYTYMWTPAGGNSASATGLCAGTYTLIVTDANGCTAIVTVTITQPPAITATTSQTDVSCNSGSNGTATVTATGGTGTLHYAWTPNTGDTTPGVTGLAAGSYTCTITDDNACSTQVTFTITEPTPLTVSIASQTNTSCNGVCDGTATVTASGGTPAYTYSWSPASATTATVTNLCAGTYTCTVTDANGCSTTITVMITEPAAVTATSTQTDVSCNGGNNGSATVSATGGTGAFTYAWSPNTSDTTATVSGLAAGAYVCTITDANNCTGTITVTITEPTVITVTIDSTLNPSACTVADGAVYITASGGAGGYTFLWNDSGNSTTEDLLNVPAGIYSCIVTDANGCSVTGPNATLNDPNAPTVTLSLPIDTLCFDDAPYVLTGASPAGGTWGGTGVSGGMLDPQVSGLGMAYITYTYTDTAGCTASVTDSMDVDICLNIDPVNPGATISLYPNPAGQQVSFTAGFISNHTLVEIFTAEGRLIRSEIRSMNGTEQTLNLEGLAPGMYFLKITAGEHHAAVKFLKQ